jgi:hypothetical protein
MVLVCFFVDFSIVDPNSSFTIFLWYHEERGDPLDIKNWIDKVGCEQFP